nr:chorismate-binding protein [Acetobacter malorum]
MCLTCCVPLCRPALLQGRRSIGRWKLLKTWKSLRVELIAGACSVSGWKGRLESSVIIRTLVRKKDSLTLAAGGGITILSDARKEYEEMRLKLAPFLALFGDEA